MTAMSLAFDILARDRASQTFENVGQAAEQSGGKMSALGGAAKVAFAAVGGAAVAGAIKGITAFADFQGQMNEVFTLLPGISQDAMDGMTGQVKGFAKEFGVLPENVVPALYQSLSAGVPQDNVFAFLETAQQAAKGGVTDLTVAVDGISSVVNAYGSDVISATAASDQMFTAVKLGKTNFEQLSSSLANVTPIASGLGVQFGDVSAALATMTSKGTPTAVATTQLRSLFVELSKAGGEAATTFEEMAGKSFQQFIAEGGNTAEALALMQKAADDSGVALQDMFGSVEAGSAALSLSGSDSFTNNIEAMAESAGATEAAFDQMNQGLGPIFDRIKSNLSVFFIDVGQRLAPVIEGALGLAGDAFERISTVVSPILEEIGGGIKAFLASWRIFDGDVTSAGFPGFMERAAFVLRTAFETVSAFATETLIPALKELGSFIVDELVPAVVDLAGWVVDKVGPALADMAEWVADDLVPALADLAGWVADDLVPALRDFGEWLSENRPVMIGIATALTAAVIPAIYAKIVAVKASTAAWLAQAAAVVVANAPLVAIAVAIGAVAAGFVWAYENVGWFRDAVDTVASFLTGTVWPAIQTGVGFLVDNFVPAVSAAAGWVMDFGTTAVEIFATVASWIGEKIGAIVGFFTGTLLPVILNVIQWYWDIYTAVFGALGAAAEFVADRVRAIAGFFSDLASTVGDIASTIWDPLSRTFKGVVNAIIDAWNRLDFSIDIRVPGWVPGIGGKGFQVDDVFPDVPRLHTGGTYRAPAGAREGLAMLLDGERVLDLEESAEYESGSAGGDTFYFQLPPHLLRRPGDVRRELQSARHLTGKR